MDPDSKRPPSRAGAHGAAGPGLRVSVSDGRGRSVADNGLARWIARVAPKGARGDLAIALVSDARMRALNRRYRGKDYATDVLSFAGGEGSLGDVVIATGVARRQAREAGHSCQTEQRVLVLHGLLHLLGYDHDDPRDAGRMARAEARLRRRGALRAGLMERRRGKPAKAAERRARTRRGAGRREPGK